MKKLLCLLTAVSLLLCASACGKDNGNGNDGSQDTSASQKVSMSCADIYNNQIASVITLPEMVSVKEKALSNTYGIDSSMYTDYVFMTAQEATLADTVIIIKATNPESVSQITDKLNNFITMSLNTSVDYNPDQYEIVRKASVKTEGDFVYLVFSKDMDTIENIIKGALS